MNDRFCIFRIFLLKSARTRIYRWRRFGLFVKRVFVIVYVAIKFVDGPTNSKYGKLSNGEGSNERASFINELDWVQNFSIILPLSDKITREGFEYLMGAFLR